MYKQIFNFGVIILCIALLQYHSVRFWIEQVSYIGVAWSLLLECVNFWLWFNRRYWLYLVLGVLTAAILLIGPLYETSNVLFLEQNYTTYNDTDLKNKTDDLNQKLLERDKLLSLIESGRIGYRDDYRRTEESINNLRRDISGLGLDKAKTRQTWQTYLVVIIQAIAICIFNIVVILAILSLDIRTVGVKKVIKEIRWRIEALQSNRGLSLEEIAKRLNATEERKGA